MPNVKLRAAYELFREMMDSPGMEYLNRKKRRAFTVNIFRGNYTELQNACAFVENPDNGLRLMSEAMKGPGTQMHMEVMRLFHNFLAAAKSLVDHTRVFVEDHYAGTPLSQAYEQKVLAEFANDPLSKFIQDLRNYMLHRGLPGGSMSLSITRTEERAAHDLVTTVSISREDLLKWKGWTKLSLGFLNGADKEIKISELSKAYGEKILLFYDWFDKKMDKHHEAEIVAFEALRREYALADEFEAAQRART